MKNIVFIFFWMILYASKSQAQVVLNEVHYNPANDISGDANGDGVRSASQDEFVEIVNGGDIQKDLSGWTISDADGVSFTFPTKTTLGVLQAVVIFGGGTPNGDFGNSLILKGSLGLNNADNFVVLKNEKGETVDSMFYKTSSAIGKSLTRHPDITGNFIASTNIGTGKLLFSTGLTTDLKTFSTITSLNDLKELTSLEIFPNPASDIFNIHGELDYSDKFELIGFQGEIITLKLENDRLRIPEECKNGVWILKTNTAKGVFYRKVEILR